MYITKLLKIKKVDSCNSESIERIIGDVIIEYSLLESFCFITTDGGTSIKKHLKKKVIEEFDVWPIYWIQLCLEFSEILKLCYYSKNTKK